MKYAYSFDDNGNYVGVVQCQRNPRNPKAWLLPANATLTKPDLSISGSPVYNIFLDAWEFTGCEAPECQDDAIEKMEEIKNEVALQEDFLPWYIRLLKFLRLKK